MQVEVKNYCNRNKGYVMMVMFGWHKGSILNHPSPCFQYIASFLPKATHIIQWTASCSRERGFIYSLMLYILIFKPDLIPPLVHGKFVNHILPSLKFIFNANITSMPSHTIAKTLVYFFCEKWRHCVVNYYSIHLFLMSGLKSSLYFT